MKSKLEVPGKGGVGGMPFLGLPVKETLSGVRGCLCDPAEILLCWSRFGDLVGATSTISQDTMSGVTLKSLPFSDCLSTSSIRLDMDGRDGLGGVFRSILVYDGESIWSCRML